MSYVRVRVRLGVRVRARVELGLGLLGEDCAGVGFELKLGL